MPRTGHGQKLSRFTLTVSTNENDIMVVAMHRSWDTAVTYGAVNLCITPKIRELRFGSSLMWITATMLRKSGWRMALR